MKIRAKLYRVVLWALATAATGSALGADPAAAGKPVSLKEIAQKAVLANPEVQSRWHAFRAATEETRVMKGGYLPRVDATVGSGHENLKQPRQADLSYTRSGYVLSLNQMLFDGFATQNDVKRLSKAELVRYYELLDASETTALEAARAYYDVMRYRFLVNLAEENYVQHKATYEQLVRRTQSGVGRRADMEQAGSRLALAESNLTTELANLHDVSARYQRIVGEQPPAVVVGLPQLAGQLPGKVDAALARAAGQHPALLASVENIESAQFDVDARRAAFFPRLDLRARTDNTSNYLGVTGERTQSVVELVVNYNLFNGGSDQARERQYVERKYIAQDLRDKACRDVRQTLVIAYNDVARLKEQLNFTETQVSLLEKTRDAYRDQFNIGQRTLLDLLDTENELLNARRSAINTDIDHALAYLRVYAGMGNLLDFLGLKRLDSDAQPGGETVVTRADGTPRCPTDNAPVAVAFDRDALDARAAALVEENAKAGLMRGAQPVAQAGGPDSIVSGKVKAWASAWMAKDYAAYAAFYAPTFTPEGGLTREDWATLRQSRLSKPYNISVDVLDLKVRLDGDKRAFAEFRQVYSSDRYRDTTDKVLEFVKNGDQWLIQRESAVPVPVNEGGRR